MIATQYQAILPSASSFRRLSFRLSAPTLWDEIYNRYPNTPKTSTASSFPDTTSIHVQSSKRSAPESQNQPVKPQSGALSPPIMECFSSEDDHTSAISVQDSNRSRASSHGSIEESQADHIIRLSSIEQLMPRAYIRICLAYRVPNEAALQTAIDRLRTRVRKIVDAKPYLSGYVTDVKPPDQEVGRAEVRFSTQGYLTFPEVEVRTLLNNDGSDIDYDELDKECLPPSRLRPEDVSALPPNVNPSDLAPVFRVQANIVKGGLIVSIYLHHCISDGTGLDLITTGDVMRNETAFRRWASPCQTSCSNLEMELREYARQKTLLRQRLSYVPPNPAHTRNLKGRRLDGPVTPASEPGRGCVMMISARKILLLLQEFNTVVGTEDTSRHTKNSVLMALLWRHMTRARRPSIQHNTTVKTSSLLIPVDIRQKIKKPLQENYFGAVVDSARAELDLDSLTQAQGKTLREISVTIREAVAKVNDSYVRQAIALANTADRMVDVSDLQASCMDRATGADMYITSWLRLRTYESDLGMGLGGPDWVRKPWSRDPGSCIILPQKSEEPDYHEVVVQMTKMDMERLLVDQEFMAFVDRVID